MLVAEGGGWGSGISQGSLKHPEAQGLVSPARSVERGSAVLLRGGDGDIGYERQTPAP